MRRFGLGDDSAALRRRWKVERSLAWLSTNRWLTVRLSAAQRS
jgi:hypothetical protein